MSATIVGWALLVAHAMLAVGMLLAAFRLFRGPRAQDRVLAIDAININAMLQVVLLGIRAGTDAYFEAALVMALLGFVSSAALAKFLMRGEVIE
ncbi:MAG: K+/H+ antiporter subunit F [Deinococcales bacterium]|nr:K+/H+ antiporter subunit F [Deinococcales bacterium]